MGHARGLAIERGHHRISGVLTTALRAVQAPRTDLSSRHAILIEGYDDTHIPRPAIPDVTRDLTDRYPVAADVVGMPPRPLIGKLHELRARGSSGKTPIDVVLELLRLGVTFPAKLAIMPSRDRHSSAHDSGHDCKDNNRPGSRGHRFMVTVVLHPV